MNEKYKMNFPRAALFVCWASLCMDVCLSQTDCTDVDCPELQRCIESVLEKDACCPTCTQRGCTCEGYQYYDCIQAGFRKGKVPEGQSYFVDFGSTECSCPEGGGRISCHFIPCPDIPPNCIEILQPADGCMECGRVGCTQGNKKYDAGHSFHMDQCHVCHCPSEGGRLMCSPIPDCDPPKVNKPMGTTTDNSDPRRDVSSRHEGQLTSPAGPFSKLAAGKTLPLHKLDPPSSGTEDYDYTLAEPTSPPVQDPAQPLESTTVLPVYPESSSAPFTSHSGRRHETRGKQKSPTSVPSSRDEVTQNVDPTTTRKSLFTATTTQRVTTEGGDQSRRQNRVVQVTPKDTVQANKTGRHLGHHKRSQGRLNSNHGGSVPSSRKSQDKVSVEPKQDQGSNPTIQFSPTSRAPVRVREHGDGPRRQSQTLFNYQPRDEDEDKEVSAKELVKTCCETGEKWASANGHCNNMEPPTRDRHSICWTAQRQCCSGSLSEPRCLAGVAAAQAGSACEDDAGGKCGIDPYKECCDCCSLGLQFQKEGHPCEVHPHLGHHCRHVFVNCCRGEEDSTQTPQDGWHSVRERPTQESLPPPQKVSDSPNPRQAFSIGGDGEVENAVEAPVELEDINECEMYKGSVCDQICVNTAGSFRCECLLGFALQADGYTCAPEMLDEDNTVSESDRAAKEPTSPFPTTTIPVDPCEGNGPCEQQCAPVDGRPQCACSPGFSLRPDGHTCQDVNECSAPSACQTGERCVNTAGSFVCQRPITCPPGYQINNDMCEDMNECALMRHNCGPDYDCVNTEGSFRCNPKPRCPVGFTLDAQGICIDIDECAGALRPCGPAFNCVNSAGSYMCQRKMICSRGYHSSPDGSRCIDVDECQSGLHHCGDDQLCHNLPGSYRCECQAGFQYDSFQRTCVDINECWRYQSRLCAQTCENTPGSYQCSCTTGFRLAEDGKSCEDVNECLANPCGQECANIYGSYQCYCRQGYHLLQDGHTCEDIDECSQSIGHLCTYKCVNVPGSYECACPDYGYTMSPNGRSCRDIDECTTGAHNCSLAETCYNIQGGYRCLALDCPPNYRKVSDTRCERISCPNYLECQNSPLRITYYYLSFQSNIIIPAQIFRIGPSPAYSGDNVIVSITHGNEEGYFSTRKLTAYTGAVYLHRQVEAPKDFLLNVEMKLWRQGTFTTFQARIYVFITGIPL